MLVKDTIHHGDYYNERVVELSPVYVRFVEFLNSGPYGAGDGVKTTNKYAYAAFTKLIDTGKSDFGWRRFEIIRRGSL